MTWTDALETLRQMLREEEVEIWFLDDRLEVEKIQRDKHIKKATALIYAIQAVEKRVNE